MEHNQRRYEKVFCLKHRYLVGPFPENRTKRKLWKRLIDFKKIQQTVHLLSSGTSEEKSGNDKTVLSQQQTENSAEQVRRE